MWKQSAKCTERRTLGAQCSLLGLQATGVGLRPDAQPLHRRGERRPQANRAKNHDCHWSLIARG
eukprot:3413974-Prorocentrum_lima.AAC.1